MIRMATSRQGRNFDSWAVGLALGAVALACFSRTMVGLGAPSALNFLHFPLIILALGLVSHPPLKRLRRYGSLLIALLVWTFGSASVNGGEYFRALLTFLVWAEPLLLVYVVWAASIGAGRELARRYGRLVIGVIVGAQFVFMIFQIPFRADGPDFMQGTFIGSGTGAHVAPTLALIGGSFGLAALLKRKLDLRWLLLPGLALTLSMLGAARAVIGTWLVAMAVSFVLLILLRRQNEPKRIAGIAMAIAVGGLIAAIALPRLDTVPDVGVLGEGLEIKLIGLQAVAEAMAADPAVLVAGQGPGLTLSRVAVGTPGVSLNPESPIAALRFQTTDFTLRVARSMQLAPIGRSSLFAPWSSILGIAGDVGVVGLIIYLSAWWSALSAALSQADNSNMWWWFLVQLAVFALLLGVQQVYLEDPGFSLIVGLLVGLGAGGLLTEDRKSPRITMATTRKAAV